METRPDTPLGGASRSRSIPVGRGDDRRIRGRGTDVGLADCGAFGHRRTGDGGQVGQPAWGGLRRPCCPPVGGIEDHNGTSTATKRRFTDAGAVGDRGARKLVTNSTPDGAVWLCHVAPPSVVPTMTGVRGLPNASQTDVEAHETAERAPTPAGRLSVAQSPRRRKIAGRPPALSDPRRMWQSVRPPAAMHTDAEKHETEEAGYRIRETERGRPTRTPIGGLERLFQAARPAVRPPDTKQSEDMGTSHPRGRPRSDLRLDQPVELAVAISRSEPAAYHPTAVQAEAEKQETPRGWSCSSREGEIPQPVTRVHVPLRRMPSDVSSPPRYGVLFVRRPTAMHSDVEGHETPENESPCETERLVAPVPRSTLSQRQSSSIKGKLTQGRSEREHDPR